MGLPKEWRNVSLMMKTQQNFDFFTLNDHYNLLKAHKNEVNEVAEESKINLGGPLALVSKVLGRVGGMEATEKESSEDEGLIVNSDDEAVAFYFNNRVKKFYKNPFNGKLKVGEMRGSNTRKVSDEKKFEKKEVKAEDSGVDCHYCHGANHMVNDYMLKKKEEKMNRVKDEAYYSKNLEELRAKSKGMLLVARGEYEDEIKYQIWSSGSDDEEMINLTHGAMFVKFEEDEDEKIIGRCFVLTSADKAPMTSKVCSLLQSFNIPSSAYNSMLTEFDDVVTYVNNQVISASNEAKKSTNQLVETQRMLEAKKAKIDHLEMQITNIMINIDSFNGGNRISLKQRNIYCNSAKRLYCKITELHHSSDISKEQHKKLLPFLSFEREKGDATSYDSEMTISDIDKVPDNRYRYGIVKIDEHLDANDLVDIVNKTLIAHEKIKILKKNQNSTSDSQSNFADIGDDNINEIKVEEGKEKCQDLNIKVNKDQSPTSNVFNPDHVTVEDSQTDNDDDDEVSKETKDPNVLKETQIPRIAKDQVYKETKKFDKTMKEKSSHYLEPNYVVYPNFKCTDNVVFSNQSPKEKIQRISQANGISMNKARNKAYRNTYVSKKKQQIFSSKPSEKRKSEFVKTTSENPFSACKQGKQHRQGHPIVIDSKIVKPLELLHIDLCSPSIVETLNKKSLKKKVCKIKSDNGSEFKNKNGVVERRNLSLREAARMMLTYANLPQYLWAEVVSTACFTQNQSFFHRRFDITPYEIIKNKKLNDSTVIEKTVDHHSTTNSPVYNESLPVLQNDKVEGEHLTSTTHVKGEHSFERENGRTNAGSENDETFEDAPSDFDPSYPPMDKWTQNHRYQQILGDSQARI
ncbi:uncharacterized protein LOC111885248 [Lactuca sativa]|uniref:uncharacterized protein LOC111885248 n=1 Tax=Lactuca sativa TaxID=4236 RepID=UPI000CD85F28|nr:uncharacterized protein LOC111885248 [Lactuca sativa]